MYYLQTSIVVLICALLVNGAGIEAYVFFYATLSLPLFYQDKRFFAYSSLLAFVCGTFFFFYSTEVIFPLNTFKDYPYIAASFLILGVITYITIHNMDKSQRLLIKANQESEKSQLSLESSLQQIQMQTEAVRSFSEGLTDHVSLTSKQFRQITSSFQEMQQATKQQSQALAENSLDVERIVAGAGTVAEGSRRMNEQVYNSNTIIEESANQMEELEQHTLHMDRLFSETETVTQELHEKLNSIKGMSELIGNVAQQTGLLSLNASITAEKAGDGNGRAFAVIAEEVRVLAASAEEAAATIQTQIRSIVSISDTTLLKMKASRQSVDKTLKNSQAVKQSLEGVKGKSREIVNEIQKIQNETENLRFSLGNINTQSSNLSAISEENSAQLEGLEGNLLQLQTSMTRIEDDFKSLHKQLNQ